MTELVAWLTVLAMGSIAGIGVTTQIVIYPILRSMSRPAAIELFKPFFMLSHKIVIRLSMGVTFMALVASITSGNWWWLVMGLFMHFNGPYSYFRMMPINTRLMADDIDINADQTKLDIEQWGYLNMVKVAVSCLVFAVFVILAMRG